MVIPSYLIVFLVGAFVALLTTIGSAAHLARRVTPSTGSAAEALAAGLMLASSYLLIARGAPETPVSVVFGLLVGAAYSYSTHRIGRVARSSRSDDGRGDENDIRGLLSRDALHAALEGVAIGTAMSVSLKFGLIVAATLAIHNIAEGVSMGAPLVARGVTGISLVATSIGTKLPQPIFALATFLAAAGFPSLKPAAIGFAAGGLLYLALSELLPSSYSRRSRKSVALIVTIAAAAVILLREILR